LDLSHPSLRLREVDVTLCAEAVEERPRNLYTEVPVREPPIVLADPAGRRPRRAERVRRLTPRCRYPVVGRKRQIPRLKERGHRRHHVGARHANAFPASFDNRFGRANRRTDRIGRGVVCDGGDERLKRIGVERARQHKRLVDVQVENALDLEHGELAIATCLNDRGLEICVLDACAQDVVARSAAPGLEPFNLLEALVRKLEVPHLNLIEPVAEQCLEVGALHVHRYAGSRFRLIVSGSLACVAGGTRAREDAASLEESL